MGSDFPDHERVTGVADSLRRTVVSVVRDAGGPLDVQDLADRRKVTLAVPDEPTDEGTNPPETAVVGEGEENSLVVPVRELLGSRLDHLDYQAADFGGELPT